MTTQLRKGMTTLATALVAGGVLLSGVATADYSSANRLLFMTEHLEGFDAPGDSLEYRFTREGSWDDPFEDTIRVRISDIQEGHRIAEIDVFEDESRHRPMAPVRGATGNPALLAFLQLDVGEMGRQTDVAWQSFQSQIRSVFAYADAEPTTVEFNGEEVEARSVRIIPFANASDGPTTQGEAQVYEQKRYEFILSENVPGYIYEIRTELPNPEEGVDEPLMVDTMRFESADNSN